MEFGPTHNLLIVSDLHLGADLKRTGFAWLRGVATLDREFGAFLEWYAAHPEGGLPWRLIANGDMVDFINITMLPTDEEARAAGFEVSEAERTFGLTGEEAKVAWMLGRIVDRHRALFVKLANFIAAGNELTCVRGNHDVEFVFPRVQALFKQALAGISGLEGEDREAFLSRIVFLPWFYYEPGAIYVEHGNQYDDYSSFEYVLAPVAPSRPGEIDLPLSHFAIRYMTNALHGISTDDKDGWTLTDYARLIVSGKAGSLRDMLGSYVGMLGYVARSLVARHFSPTDGKTREEHHSAVASLAREYRLPEETLAKVQRLHRGHALRSLFVTAQCFYADRFALAGMGIVLVIASLAGFSLSSLAFLLAFATLALVVAVDRLLSRSRSSEIPPKLARAGQTLAALMGVPLVVMGHSHHPCEVRHEAGGEARYVNTGTWIPPHGDAPGFTHLRVRRADAVEGRVTLDAELRRWNPAAAGPEPVVKKPRDTV